MNGFEEVKEHIAPKILDFGWIQISESLLYAIIVSLMLITFAVVIRIFYLPKFSLVPKKLQIFLEWLVSFFEKMSEGSGHIAKFLAPYTFGVAAFICVGTLFELFGLRTPIADINTTLALSLMTFLLINFFGIQKHGPIGRIKYFFKPSKIVGPFRIMSDLMVPVSMSFRLFGSILSGMITMEIVYVAVKLLIFLPVIVPVIFIPIFTLFHAFIQSYIFAMLTVTFVGEAAE